MDDETTIPQDSIFTVDDLYLAAGLTLLAGAEPKIYPDGRGRVTFHFPSTPETIAAFSAYNGGTTGQLSEYARIIKRLRGSMLKRRDEAGGAR